jgi:hypothetical protein
MVRFISVVLAITALAMAAQSDAPTSGDSQAASIASIHRAPYVENHTLAALGFSTSPTGTTKELGCCKICTVGKACGNTCISKYDICHVGPGCACDG